MMKNNKLMERESNAELLRLVCMFFIVLHHILVHGAFADLLGGIDRIDSAGERVALLINGFTFIAVNVFLLISGFYGINVSVKKFLNLYVICAFYGFLDCLLTAIRTGDFAGRSILACTFLPFSHSSYWFIPVYVALFCISPLLNAFIKSSSRKDYLLILVFLTFVNVWLGSWNGYSINLDGFNVMQFIYIYVIGGYIKRFVDLPGLKCKRYLLFGIYVLSAICWTIFGIMQSSYPPFRYNNPFIIIGAIAFFLFAMTFSFRSRGVNFFASSALAVYLIQSSPFAESLLYPKVNAVTVSGEFWGGLLFFIFALIALGITVFCCLFDKLRVLLMIPVSKLIDRVDKWSIKFQS